MRLFPVVLLNITGNTLNYYKKKIFLTSSACGKNLYTVCVKYVLYQFNCFKYLLVLPV